MPKIKTEPKFKEKTRLDRWKTILQIAWPLIIANSFWNLQLTIDRIMLGNYSTAALGAAVAVMGVFWTPMALLQQTSAYLMTFVAQYFGAKKFKMIGPAVWQSLYVSVVGGLAFLLFIPVSQHVFNFMGHATELRLFEKEYFDAICYSALPTAIVAAVSAFYTGLGNTRIVIWINLVGLVANAILDYIMIFGKFGFPEMGAAGAGYATSIATAISAVFALFLMMNRDHEKKFRIISAWKFNLDLMIRFIRYGLPSGAQWALEGLAFTVFLIIVGRMPNGPAALSASSIAITIMMLSILPALGVAQAVSVLVGQHLGENKPKLAEASTWSGYQVALMYIVAVGSTFVLFPQFYLGWFHNVKDPVLWSQVQVIVPYLLMFVAFFTCFDAMNFVFTFALKGAGDTRFVSAVVLFLPWPMMVLPTWLIRDWPGGIYWAWGIAAVYGVTQAMIFLRRFLGGKWKKMSVIH
jgi:MATE family multidrug resistance protein